jgi:hypothetical protein
VADELTRAQLEDAEGLHQSAEAAKTAVRARRGQGASGG